MLKLRRRFVEPSGERTLGGPIEGLAACIRDRLDVSHASVRVRHISRRSDHGLCICAVTDHEEPPDWLCRSTTSVNV
jgi:hypothetical protein